MSPPSLPQLSVITPDPGAPRPARLYPLTRDLHLYLGLFVSPFILVFAVSVFFLVHAWLPQSGASNRRTVSNLPLPADFEKLRGREQFDAARPLLAQAGVSGEIMSIRQFPKERLFVISSGVPGRETVVEFLAESRSATVTARTTGLADATVFLHKMPGPHNVAIRGNTLFMAVWRWLADATVYLVMFVSLAGVYLWTVLKTERRIGLALLVAGLVTLGGMTYALVA